MRHEKKTATLMFRVAHTERERAELHCKAKGIKLSDFLRDLLAAALVATESNPSCSTTPRCRGA
jgi:hypothetical protein